MIRGRATAPLVVAAALVLLLVLPGTAQVRSAGEGAPHAPRTAATPTGPSRESSVSAPPLQFSRPGHQVSHFSAGQIDPVGQVGYTWDLTNNTAWASSLAPPLHWEPSALAVVRPSGSLWVAWGPNPYRLSDNITLVNLTSNQVVGELRGTSNATNLDYEADLGLVFVTRTVNAAGLGQLLILNATTGALVGGPISLGYRPAGMAYDPYAHLLYVLSNGSGVVSSLDIPSGVYADPFIAIGGAPSAAVYSPVSGDVYVTNYASGNITVLNGSTGQLSGPTIAFPNFSQPNHIVASPQTGKLLVTFRSDTNYSSGIGVIDPSINAALTTLEMPVFTDTYRPVGGAELDPRSGFLVLTIAGPTSGNPGTGSKSVVTYDPETNTATDRTTVYNPAGNNASVEAIDTSTGVDYIGHWYSRTGVGPAYLSTIDLWTANYSSGPMVILGASARGGTFDTPDGTFWVADSYSSASYGSEPDTLAALDLHQGSVAQTVQIGYEQTGFLAGSFSDSCAPQSVALDPMVHELVIANGAYCETTYLNASTGAYAGVGAYLRSQSLPNDWAPGASEVVYDAPHQRIYVAGPLGWIVWYNASNLSLPHVVQLGSAPPFADRGWVQSVPYATLAVDPSDGYLYDVTPGGTFGVGGPSLVAYDPFSSGSNATGTAVLGPGGTGVGSAALVDPADRSLYVADARANVVYVLNLTDPLAPKNVATIPVGQDPVALAYLPSTRSVVVANFGSANLTVLNGTTPQAGLGGAFSIPVAAGPSALIVDPAQNDTFMVTSSLLGTVQEVSPVPVLFSYTVSRNSTDVGVGVTLHPVAVAGVGADSYSYSGLPPGCTSQNASTLLCVPTAPGTFAIGVVVTDQGLFSATGSVVLQVVARPTIRITGSTPAIDVGLPFGATAAIVNGTPPLSVSWEFGDQSASVSGTTAEHAYLIAGTYRVRAVVTDGLGSSANDSMVLQVGGALGSAMSGPAGGAAGSPVAFNGSAFQGVAPYQFTWTFGDGGSVHTGVVGSVRPNSSEVSHIYGSTGKFHVTVLVVDGAGERALSQWNVTMGPPVPSSTPPGTLPPTEAPASAALPTALLVGTVLSAAALVTLLGYSWRGHRPRK